MRTKEVVLEDQRKVLFWDLPADGAPVATGFQDEGNHVPDRSHHFPILSDDTCSEDQEEDSNKSNCSSLFGDGVLEDDDYNDKEVDKFLSRFRVVQNRSPNFRFLWGVDMLLKDPAFAFEDQADESDESSSSSSSGSVFSLVESTTSSEAEEGENDYDDKEGDEFLSQFRVFQNRSPNLRFLWGLDWFSDDAAFAFEDQVEESDESTSISSSGGALSIVESITDTEEFAPQRTYPGDQVSSNEDLAPLKTAPHISINKTTKEDPAPLRSKKNADKDTQINFGKVLPNFSFADGLDLQNKGVACPEDPSRHREGFAQKLVTPTSTPCTFTKGSWEGWKKLMDLATTSTTSVSRKQPREEGSEGELTANKKRLKQVHPNEPLTEKVISSPADMDVSGEADTEKDTEEPMPSTSGLGPGGLRGGEDFRGVWFRPNYSLSSDSD